MMFRWLAKQAAQKIAGQAAGKAQQRAKAAAAPPIPCDVVFLFALNLEAHPLADQLVDIELVRRPGLTAWTGRLARRRVGVAIGGVGAAAARRAAAQLSTACPSPVVVVAGLAGGLTSDWRQGDILLAHQAVRVGEAPVETLELAEPRTPWPDSPHARRGALLTVPAVVRVPSERKQLAGLQLGAACDMESYFAIEALRDAGVPGHVVRVISDTAEEELPAELASVLAQPTTAGKLGAAAGALFRQPGHAKELWRLRNRAADVSRTLADYLVTWLRAWPPDPVELAEPVGPVGPDGPVQPDGPDGPVASARPPE